MKYGGDGDPLAHMVYPWGAGPPQAHVWPCGHLPATRL